ncbi:unnamed protein product [Ectocarpus sp. 12 AP-2014]
MSSLASSGSGGGRSGGSSSSSRSHSQGDKHDRRRREKDRERVEKERVRKEHARKVLEDQKINKARRKWQKQTEFLCTIKFRNSLPDPPLGPHFLDVPLDLQSYVKYKPTTLESDYKWKLHYERDLGVPIDVIDPRNYLLPKKAVPLPPEDEALLNWREGDGPGSVKKEDLSTSARRKTVDTSVTWLKKTVYLTNDPFDPVHQFKSEQQTQADKEVELEKEIARGKKQDRKVLIEESFLHANSNKPLVHQDASKRHLTAEWVMPVMPDVSLWPNTYTTVMFDKDPAADETVKGSEARKRKRAGEALVCNVKRTTFEGNSHEVITGSYLMPKDKATKKGEREEEEEEEEEKMDVEDGSVGYDFVKDYKFNIVHYAQTQYDGNPHLLFVINKDTQEASFCKLSAKVELANLPRGQGQPATGRGAVVSKRNLSQEEVSNARKKVSADLQLEGEYHIAGENGLSNGGHAAGGDTGVEGDEGGGGGGWSGGGGENGHANGSAGLNGHSDESRAWNGTSDVDRESVLSMTMESEASNVAVKGTESSEGDIAGAHTDDDEDSEP